MSILNICAYKFVSLDDRPLALLHAHSHYETTAGDTQLAPAPAIERAANEAFA